MRRTSVLLAGFAALALVLSPGLADARAGGGGSMGSRGSMTYSAPPSTRTAPYSAAPMQRSMTPYQNQTSPGYAGSGYRGGGMMRGLMGGLFAAGLFGLMFGHGFMGGGLGMFGLLGLLLQIVLVVVVVRFLFRMFSGGRSAVMAGGPNMGLGGGMSGPVPNAGPSGPPTIPITPPGYPSATARTADNPPA
jgi:predicted lipid-binding transport protein (Tim44 family)